MFYAVTYDIYDSKKDHTPFFERIKTLGRWMHYINDTWILSTPSSAKEIFEVLKPLIDEEEDYVLVVEIEPSNSQGWLPKKAWEWLQEAYL